MANENRKILLSLKNVTVKFNVRGRILTAIRNVSLDIFENESIAIVGESGSGKSVLTKTFAGMLENNGFIPEGSIIFADDELSDTRVKLTARNRHMVKDVTKMLNKYSVLERGAAEYMQILAKEQEIRHKKGMNTEEEEQYAAESKELKDAAIDTRNYIQTLDKHSKTDQAEIARCEKKLAEIEAKTRALEDRKNEAVRSRSTAYSSSAEAAEDAKELENLRALRQQKISKADQQENPYGLKDEVIERNKILAYETLLSIGRYPVRSQISFMPKLRKAFRDAMKAGEDLRDQGVLNRIFQTQILCAGDPLRAEVTTAGASVMNGSGLYYLGQLSNEEFYWLLHVIAAEAGNQSLAGQLGVGNVVMNRVKNEDFPDSVKQVVFQQGDDRAIFTPVDNGDIHMVSDDLSLIAAYLVLEGYNNVGDSLYFVNPTVGNSSWFTANRTFVVRIGDHDFYA